MKKIILIIAIVILPLLSYSVRVKLVKSTTIKTDFKARPTIYVQSPLLVDDGKMIYMAKSAAFEQDFYVYFLKLPTLELVKKQIPINEFFSKNEDLLINNQSKKRNRNTYSFDKMLFYDSKNGLAGFNIINKLSVNGIKKEQIYVLIWDLNSNKIKKAHLIATLEVDKRKTFKNYHAFYPSTYVSDTKIFYGFLYIGTAKKKEKMRGSRRYASYDYLKTVGVKTFKISEEEINEVTYFKTKVNKISGDMYYFAQKNILFIPEYYEEASNTKGVGYVIDLNVNKIKTISIPFTTYGVDMSKDGRYLYFASSQTGNLWKVNTKNGKLIKRFYVGKRGHFLKLMKNEKLLWIRNSGLQFINEKRMRKDRYFPFKKFYSGFSHVEGSLAGDDFIFIKNGNDFHYFKVK